MRSEHYLRDGLAAFRQAADWNGEARVLWSLGHLALEQGNLERARATFLDALQMDAELNYKHGIAIVLEGLADLATDRRSVRARRAPRCRGGRRVAQQSAPVVQVIVQVPVHGGGLDHASS